MLTEVADSVIEALSDKLSYLLAHAGSGTFVCIYHSESTQSGPVIERAIQKSLNAKVLHTRDRRPLNVTVSASQTLKPNFSSAKRSDRVFRVAIAQAEARLGGKIAPPALSSNTTSSETA